MGIISWIKQIVSKRKARAIVLVRGVPGSGKSTLSEMLAKKGKYPVLAADDYFMRDGEYKWDPKKLGAAVRTDAERPWPTRSASYS